MSEEMPITPRPGDPVPPSPDELAARALDGDEQAFEELYQRLSGGLRNFLRRRLGTRAELIEELGQASWVEVWRAVRQGRYDPRRAGIVTFVYAVGNKMLLRHYRAAGRSSRAPLAVGQQDRAASLALTGPDDLLQYCELLDAVRDCLRRSGTPDSLTDEERAIVTAAAEDESERSLARRLGIAASTVNARKHAAYAKLRRCLARKGFSGQIGERG